TPAFGDQLANYRVHATLADIDHNIIYLLAESRSDDSQVAFRGHLDNGSLDRLAESKWGPVPAAHSADHSQVVLNEGYTIGDSALYLLREGETGGRQVLYGTPLEERKAGKTYPLNAIFSPSFTPGNQGLLL